jgi:hypothetical protein
LRDDLRDLKIEKGFQLQEEVFYELQSGINSWVIRLSQIDLGLLHNTNRLLEENESLRKLVTKRAELLEQCSIPKVQRIRDRLFDRLDMALVTNSAGWLPYLVPILFGLLFADSAKMLVKKAFAVPETDLDKIAPPLPA